MRRDTMKNWYKLPLSSESESLLSSFHKKMILLLRDEFVLLEGYDYKRNGSSIYLEPELVKNNKGSSVTIILRSTNNTINTLKTKISSSTSLRKKVLKHETQ